MFEIRSYSSKNSSLSPDLFEKWLHKSENDVEDEITIKTDKGRKKKTGKQLKKSDIKFTKNFFNFSRTELNQVNMDESSNEIKKSYIKPRNSDNNNCKKVHSIIHQILKRDKIFG